MHPDIERPNDHQPHDHPSGSAVVDPDERGSGVGRHRLRNSILAVLGVVAVLVGVTVSTGVAEARRQCTTDRYTHRITNVRVSRLATNLRSDYLRGPGTISYAKTKTAEVNASVSAEVSAEAGVVFAKASASVGTTVGGSYSKSGTWSYSKSVPRGRTARLVMFHESRSFTVTKYRLTNGGCSLGAVVYSSRVNAPVRADINVWDLQRA
jgi:hypothetical protein